MHGEKKEVNIVTYNCDQCEGTFKLKALLNSHMMKTHQLVSVDVDIEAGMKRQHSSSPGTKKTKRKKEEEKSEIKMLQDKLNEYKKEVELKYNVLLEENKKVKLDYLEIFIL